MINSLSEVKQHLSKLSTKKNLEEYCHFCGDCCHLSVTIHKPEGKEKILIKDLPCRFLRKSDKKFVCSVYKDRFKKAQWCQDLAEGMSLGLYTDRCGYVHGIGDWYKGSKILDDRLLQYMIYDIFRAIEDYHAPFSEKDLQRFREKWAGHAGY